MFLQQLASNFHLVRLNDVSVWFSYETPIAVQWVSGSKIVLLVRKNEWSVTTGKHLNQIDGGNKGERIDGKIFEKKLAKVIS